MLSYDKYVAIRKTNCNKDMSLQQWKTLNYVSCNIRTLDINIKIKIISSELDECTEQSIITF